MCTLCKKYITCVIKDLQYVIYDLKSKNVIISMTKYGHIGVSNQSDCWGRLARIHYTEGISLKAMTILKRS